jgi:23S rRNA (guanosine2251-2'-O)-methyltransferase
MNQRSISLIAHNIRSAHNVGSMMRTADGLGAAEIILTGYTPYPQCDQDTRLPHLAKKITSSIHKTALGAEINFPWKYFESIDEAIAYVKEQGYTCIALEQSPRSTNIVNAAVTPFKNMDKISLIVGNEVSGIDEATLDACDHIIEIPMHGMKESLNVSVAAGIALYYFLNVSHF